MRDSLNKLTAIEYLEDCFDKYIRWQIGDINANHYDTIMFYEDLDKAKEIFKQQILDAFEQGSLDIMHSQEYYEETFKNYVFSKKDFFEIAKIIDNNFIGSEETFTAERKNGYYYLTTNKCDDCSCIRVFCEPISINIDNIDRIADDTDGYEKIHKETALKVKKYVQSLVC